MDTIDPVDLHLATIAAMRTAGSAPTDRLFIGYGKLKLDHRHKTHPSNRVLAVVYWSHYDCAWDVSSHPISGPFMDLEAWTPLPTTLDVLGGPDDRAPFPPLAINVQKP